MKRNPGDRAFSWRRHGVVVLVLTAWLIQGAGYWMVTGAPDAKARVERVEREETGLRWQIKALTLKKLAELEEEKAATSLQSSGKRPAIPLTPVPPGSHARAHP